MPLDVLDEEVGEVDPRPTAEERLSVPARTRFEPTRLEPLKSYAAPADALIRCAIGT